MTLQKRLEGKNPDFVEAWNSSTTKDIVPLEETSADLDRSQRRDLITKWSTVMHNRGQLLLHKHERSIVVNAWEYSEVQNYVESIRRRRAAMST